MKKVSKKEWLFSFFRKISPKNNQKMGGLYVKLFQKILLPG